jgi:acylphosphatase
MKSQIVKVYGRVQGVGFRFYTQRKAKELNILGFVQNKQDASVYIEAQGETNDLNEFMDWLKIGPDWARVDRVQIQGQPLQDFESFSIK